MQRAHEVLEFWFGRGPWMPRGSTSARRSGSAAMARPPAPRATRTDPRAARAPAGARGARRVRRLGGEPQAPAGVDPSVRPGAAQCLSRHGRGVRVRSRGAGADRRRHAARGRRGARSRSSACSSIYRWNMPSRWRRRMPRSRRSSGWWREAPAELRDYCEYCGELRAQAPRHHREVRAVSASQSRAGAREHAGRERVAGRHRYGEQLRASYVRSGLTPF